MKLVNEMDIKNKYDQLSQQPLHELITLEKTVRPFANSANEMLAKNAKEELGLIREVMLNVHDYDWMSKMVYTPIY